MNGCSDKRLIELAGSYGTPAFVYDRYEVRERARRIREIMNEGLEGSTISLCYSIKANPFLIPLIMDVVDNFEVCSPGELKICEKYKVPGSMIIYSGVHKDTRDTEEAIRYGAGILTAESLSQYELIRKVSDRLGLKVSVLPRLSAKSQFGMSIDDIHTILSSQDENITIAGLHYFVGTQRTKLKHNIKEIEDLKGVFTTLRNKYDLPLPCLEYGPGLPYPYFADEDFSDTLKPVKDLSPTLQEAAGWSRLTVEMGRFIASSCGYYLTKVVDTKSSYDKNWCILDGGINHVNYLGSMMGMKVPVIKYFPCNDQDKTSDEIKEWALCGSLCTTNDVIVRSCNIKTPVIGDLLVFCNIGAYSVTEAMNLFLSRDMPRIIVADSDNDTLVRDTVHTWELNS